MRSSSKQRSGLHDVMCDSPHLTKRWKGRSPPSLARNFRILSRLIVPTLSARDRLSVCFWRSKGRGRQRLVVICAPATFTLRHRAIWQRCRRQCPGEERKENEGTAMHGRGGRGPNLGPRARSERGRREYRCPHWRAISPSRGPVRVASVPKRERQRFRARCGRFAVHFACAKYGQPTKRAIARLCPRACRT